MFPDSTCVDARLIGFLHSQSSVDPLGNQKVFISIFPSSGDLSTVDDIIQDGLNSVAEIIKSFALLGASLHIMTKHLAEGALATVVWEDGVNWCRFGYIPLLWSVLGSGGDCCSCVVA